MKKYKVQFEQTDKYVIDVLAKNEMEAIEKAGIRWNEVAKNGTYHYYQDGDTVTQVGTIYDVTDTEDPFNP